MKVGIIGSGTMGQGIARAFAQAGVEVLLAGVRPSLESPTNTKESIEKSLNKRVERGKMEQADADKQVELITPVLRTDLKDVDLIVEAGREDMELKKEIFGELDQQCDEKTILATNTSSLSITEIGEGLSRPVIGMHFFNPANAMKLVEVIPGLNTPDELVDKVVKISEDIGKTPVVVQENAGFVVNRILIPMINEGVGLLAEGIASAEDIDTAMKLGANHPMGPLELGDLVGLDVCLAIMQTIYDETGDSKYRPHPLLRKMVRGGKLGRKTGEGFHNYSK